MGEVFALCFAGHALEDALSHVAVDRDILRHLLCERPKGPKLGGLRLGGLGHKPPPSLTRAPHHTPSPDCVCSCV